MGVSVYAIAALDEMGEIAAIKIGIASCPKSRRDLLQTGSWMLLRVLCATELPSRRACHALERKAHTMLKEHQIRGEWFDFSEEVCQFVVSNIIGEL